MQLDDPRLEIIEVDGQQLFVPSAAAWMAFWEDPVLDDRRLPVPDLLRKKVDAIAPYREIIAALGFVWDRVQFYELLCVDNLLYRVFVEPVLCEFCGHRALISATPSPCEIYWGSVNEGAARNRSYGLPTQSCCACGRQLVRRRTVWQVNPTAYPKSRNMR
jgi:hypothetical protein